MTAPYQYGGTIAASDGTMSYAKIMSGYYTASRHVWDNTARVPYLSSTPPMGAAACNFVSYDDAQSIADKGAYASAQGLGGTVIWTIGQGHFSTAPVGQRDPLLDAVRAAFLH